MKHKNLIQIILITLMLVQTINSTSAFSSNSSLTQEESFVEPFFEGESLTSLSPTIHQEWNLGCSVLVDYDSSNQFNVRSEYEYLTNTTIQHRLLVDHRNASVYSPLTWNMTDLSIYGFTYSYDSTNKKYDVCFESNSTERIFLNFYSGTNFGVDFSHQNQFLCISEVASFDFENNEFNQEYGEYSFQKDTNHGVTTSLNTSIVSQGAFAGYMDADLDGGFYYTYATISVPKGEYYLAVDYQIVNYDGSMFKFDIAYRDSVTWTSAVTLNNYEDRWQTAYCFLPVTISDPTYTEILFWFYDNSDFQIVIDNINLLKANPSLVTKSYGKQELSVVPVSWDNLENPQVTEDVTYDVQTRHDSSSLASGTLTNTNNYAVTVELTNTQMSNEILLNSTIDNTASSVSNSSKSYLTPQDVEYNIKYKEWDFTDETTEDFIQTSHGGSISAENGYLLVENDGSRFYQTIRIASQSMNAEYYNVVVFSVKPNVTGSSIQLRDSAMNQLGIVYTITANTWTTYTVELDSDWAGTETMLELVFNTPTYNKKEIKYDHIFLCHKDTVSLFETDSYFYTSSTNNTLVSYLSNDESVLDENWNDLEISLRNNTIGSNNIYYYVYNDLDVEDCYISSSQYSYSFTNVNQTLLMMNYIDQLEIEIDTSFTNVYNNLTDLSTQLNTNITTIITMINTLDTNLAANFTSIISLLNSIHSNQNNFSTIVTNIASLANQLNTNISTIVTNIANLQSIQLANATTIANLLINLDSNLQSNFTACFANHTILLNAINAGGNTYNYNYTSCSFAYNTEAYNVTLTILNSPVPAGQLLNFQVLVQNSSSAVAGAVVYVRIRDSSNNVYFLEGPLSATNSTGYATISVNTKLFSAFVNGSLILEVIATDIAGAGSDSSTFDFYVPSDSLSGTTGFEYDPTERDDGLFTLNNAAIAFLVVAAVYIVFRKYVSGK